MLILQQFVASQCDKKSFLHTQRTLICNVGQIIVIQFAEIDISKLYIVAEMNNVWLNLELETDVIKGIKPRSSYIYRM